jgi:tetratricopeptide (TPR) repeat protein
LDYATFSRARGLLQRAMALDPSYAPAFSYAAYWHLFRIGQEWSTNLAADIAEAARLAASAIAIDGNDATALAIYGYVRPYQSKDFEGAIDFFDRAITISPNAALAWTFKGATLCFLGDGPGAVRCAETGVRLLLLDHYGFFAEHILAQAHYINGNFEKAISWARRADNHNARNTSNLRTLVSSLVAADRVDEAREIAARHAKIVPRFTVSAWAARTPMQGEIRKRRIERLLVAGMPE